MGKGIVGSSMGTVEHMGIVGTVEGTEVGTEGTAGKVQGLQLGERFGQWIVV